jgi:hypothetical protein
VQHQILHYCLCSVNQLRSANIQVTDIFFYFLLRLLVASLSQWRPHVHPRPVHITFVIEQSGTGTDFATSTSVFPCRYHSTNAPHSFVYHQHYIILETDINK